MFDLASLLVGIYKTSNTTKTVRVINEHENKQPEQQREVLRPSQPMDTQVEA